MRYADRVDRSLRIIVDRYRQFLGEFTSVQSRCRDPIGRMPLVSTAVIRAKSHTLRKYNCTACAGSALSKRRAKCTLGASSQIYKTFRSNLIKRSSSLSGQKLYFNRFHFYRIYILKIEADSREGSLKFMCLTLTYIIRKTFLAISLIMQQSDVVEFDVARMRYRYVIGACA